MNRGSMSILDGADVRGFRVGAGEGEDCGVGHGQAEAVDHSPPKDMVQAWSRRFAGRTRPRWLEQAEGQMRDALAFFGSLVGVLFDLGRRLQNGLRVR